MIESAQIPEEAWRKSTYSGSNGGECVEVAPLAVPGAVPVRDSKYPQGPALTFRPGAFAAFVLAVRCGEFDLF
jgi:hypothetical protein